jgi:hypothetical protein
VALVIGLAFGLAVAIGGAGMARHFDSKEPPVSLGAAAVLAGFVVLVGDGSAWLRFSLALALPVAFALAAIGWIGPAKTGVREFWARLRSRPKAILLLAVVALALAAPLVILPVPLDTDAQGFGYLSLMVRDGGTINSLAPWHPEISYLYSPGALVVFAALSKIFASVPMSSVMMGASHAVAFLFIWLAHEFGRELGLMENPAAGLDPAESKQRSDRWAGMMAFSAAASVGLWTALMDSHYTAIFALFFALAFLTSLFRCLRTGRWSDAALASLMLGAVAITHPDTTIILALCLGPFLLTVWLAVDRPSLTSWLRMNIAVPAAAAILILPWLMRIAPLIGSGIESPFQGLLADGRVSLLYHGILWPILALLGIGVYLRHRKAWCLMMVGWLLAAFEFGTFGLLARAFPALIDPLLRFTFPFSIAWHAPIIPYMALGAGALIWITDKIGARRMEYLAPRAAIAAALLIGLAMIFSDPLLGLSKGKLGLYGAFATANDVLAMRWLRDHTPADARVLNYPGDYQHQRDWEAHWAPVLSERDCVYFRMQPFFQDAAENGNGIRAVTAEQNLMLLFWRDPADSANLDRLRQAGIRYVILPESIGDPASAATSWRWQPPARLPDVRSLLKDAAYLRLVFSAGGAQVFAVQP